MKKQLVILFFLIAAASTVFGRDIVISTGAGGMLGGSFTSYRLAAGGVVDGNQIQIDATQEMTQLNYGFFAFIDAVYSELGLFFQNGSGTFSETADISGMDSSPDISGRGWEKALKISLLGKYPFVLGEKLTVFPLLGVEYLISLSQKRTQPGGYVYNRNDGLRETDKNGKAYRLSDWNAFWVHLGGGLDFELGNNLFIRGELLYGFRLMTSYESKNLDMMKSKTGDSDPNFSGLTSGPSARICAGYRLFSR